MVFLKARFEGRATGLALKSVYFIPKTDREINYLLYMRFEAIFQAWGMCAFEENAHHV